jgi:hypothetical protein
LMVKHLYWMKFNAYGKRMLARAVVVEIKLFMLL